MKTKSSLLIMLGVGFALPVATLMVVAQVGGRNARPTRPQGPCDIYAADKAPCVAAHSTTRALYAAYKGPLYQVMRQSDGKKTDIGVVAASATDGGGYANAAEQDSFCANTYCWITTIYDQSGHKNDLTQAPRGPAGTQITMGGFNNVPLADWAPVTIMGHKVYGIFIAPGMGMRNDNPHGTAVDDQAEGQYWVVNGHHYNSGCCFDYGNAEIDSRDDGDGTMETTYFGNQPTWYHGPPPGPWIMTDQENNLVGCVTTNGTKACDLPIIGWRFVTATADGEPHHWRTLGGDSQTGQLTTMFDGPRVRKSYDPMRKQGAILMGNGGDNSNGSDGTVYEAAMTEAGTFPSQETQQKVQANVVAAKYDIQRLSLTPPTAVATPPGLQTFSPGSSQESTVTFNNTSGGPATNVKLSVSVPKGWTSRVSGSTEASKTFAGPIAPGASVSATFKITSGTASFNGDLVGNASWTANGTPQAETTVEKVRNTSPVKINEFAINSTDSFIELYNAGDAEVDLSNWSLTEHPMSQAIFSSVKIPAGTKLAGKGFYLLALANSGLAVPAKKGDTTLYVRSTSGLNVGDSITIDTGSAVETRKIANLGTAAGANTTVWQPLPDNPVFTVPAGSTSVPYAALGGGPGGGFGGGAGASPFEVGQKLALGYGATYPIVLSTMEKYEIVTITEVGKPGTQAYLAADAKAGDTTLRVRSAPNISVGDKINLDIDSVGHGTETITVKSIEADAGGNGRGGAGSTLTLAAPLKFNHANNLPFSDNGTGISFKPASAHARSSNEPILPLGTGITLDSPLAMDHPINAVVHDAAVKTAGYQGTVVPNQWFGGPALGGSGNIVLRDAADHVSDSLNYGNVVDPWAAEGYQGVSPGGGNSAPSPTAGGRGGFGGRGGPADTTLRSAGRFPDGADTDSNSHDFIVQSASSLSLESAAGATNLKLTSVGGLDAGQSILIDSGSERETAVIASVGTAGGTTVGTATEVGATAIPVAGGAGFSAGQTITIDTGANAETALVGSVTGGGRGRGGPGGGSITVSSPLKMAHAVGAQVSGSGITLKAALTKSHNGGASIAGSVPTPGAPNQYARKN